MSFDLVLFGGTGDLTWRKLMPALFQAFRHGKLPPGGRILAVARDERSDDEYRAFIKERFNDVDPDKRPSEDEFARFAQMLHYRRMDLSQPEHYAGLKQWIDAPTFVEGRRGDRADVVVPFLATSPYLFPVICEQLGKAGLNGPNVRVVLEKPLGHDLASAQEINRVVGRASGGATGLGNPHATPAPPQQKPDWPRPGLAAFEPP
ncbi:MAG: glucose-6-phosphate dehydrogenase, partial [Rubrivivax sp.]|nr:glucose-6-phosphate dehydrogenase [Rubrivivax sp.]